MNKNKKRVIKFFIIRRFGIPLAILLMRLLVLTWRLDKRAIEDIVPLAKAERAIVAMGHGNALAVFPYAKLLRPHGRVLSLMTSPSRDGQLLDDFSRAFGVEILKGSSNSRAVAGSRDFIRSVRNGRIAILAIDGPRGPRLVPKAGYLGICAATDARLYIVTASASHPLKFKSWDRMFLPLPFSRITLRFTEHRPRLDEKETDAEALLRLQNILVSEARSIHSPIAEGLAESVETREVSTL